MQEASPTFPSRAFASAVLLAGFLAGTLDAIAACGRYFLESGRGPAGVFKFIASGVFGRAAFAGGMDMVLAGAAFHYCIAMGWALLYGWLTLRLEGCHARKFLSGIGWAFVVWCTMTFVVVPLSRTPRIPLTARGAVIAFLILVVCVGLPVSLVIARFHERIVKQARDHSSLVGMCLLLITVPFLGSPLAAAEPPGRVPVVVELFTSEGCSTCPPADEALKQFSLEPPPGIRVIPLAFHVDYWDGQGWRDRWSKHAWTARQRTYMKHFGLRSPYTPQMIVDGRFYFPGHDRPLAQQKIIEAGSTRKQELILTQDGRVVRIQGQANPAPATLTAFMVRDHGESSVLLGENQGKHLSHTAIVLSSESFGTLPAGKAWERSFTVPKHFKDGRVVALLQESPDGPMLGVGDLPIPFPPAP
jgi:hypothetical protein